MGLLGVSLEDQQAFYGPDEEFEFSFSSGHRELAVVTQNVDSLHQRAGSKNVIQLHGGGEVVRCMECGKKQKRNDFHSHLESVNQGWLSDALQGFEQSQDMRPDGDALIKQVDYNHVHVPNCSHCQKGFLKPDVVFFGDTVPKYRVRLCEEAVKAADGILVVGSSLAVHSAFRHVRAASKSGIPTAIVNVGETRAEAEGLDYILKIEAPAGDTLTSCAEKFEDQLASSNTAM
jgi:NAD-dependent deacetylase sirtuin 4